MSEYRIIATLGPASRQPAMWDEMLAAGATGFRLNTSHLTLPALDSWLADLEPFLARHPGADLTLDLQGSKWRLGDFAPFWLEPGSLVSLALAGPAVPAGTLPVPHADFFSVAVPGAQVRIDDAKILLTVETAGAEQVRARVERGGEVRPRKGITCPDAALRVERLGEQDQAIFERTRSVAGVAYALSYLRDAAEMRRYRALFGSGTRLAAKLERRSAMQQAAEIAAVADELWVCRGDLGAEAGLAGMAELVADLTGQMRARPLGRPVIMAGQVLEHLTAHPDPTRSEVCYLHDTLASGYAGLVLSDETAVGLDPVRACQVAGMFTHRG